MSTDRTQPERLQDIPNVGPATVADFRLLGITRPTDLAGLDPIALYHELCRVTGRRHDPCVADVFMAAVHFVETGEVRRWWDFTAKRKTML